MSLASEATRQTAKATRRVLVGQFFHESHGFNPCATTAESLSVERGDRLIAKARGTGTTLGGIISKLTALGYEIVPSVGFVAQPSGLIAHEVYARLRDEFIEVAREQPCDAIALDLHGAMGTTELSDAEGDLLTQLRAAVGPDVPIGIGLDMHAHVTGAMLQAVDVCIACKECPHTDFPECGERVVECLAAILDGHLRPVRTMAKAPMIAMDSGLTAVEPLAELKAKARALQASQPDIWDISLFEVFRFADYAEPKGQTALVLSNGAAEVAKDIAEELARWSWDHRERFRDELPDIDAALETVARAADLRPFVLGDMGDRVLAGAPGDSTAILAHALNRADRLTGVVPVTDPRSVEAATLAGLGAQVTLEIGGQITPGFSPLKVTGTVVALGDGQFVVSGAVLGGEKAKLGRTAVVLVEGRLSVLLTSEPGLTHSPAAFVSQGIDLTRQDFIVVKSGQHFQENFAGIATPLTVATPGLSYPTPGFFRWKNARFWPEHDIVEPDIRARSFGRP